MSLDKFEVVEQFGPYRFIGKSVYTRAWQESSIEIERGTWKYSDWVLEVLDGIKEYATDQKHNHALFSWGKFCETSQLMGYTVGRFMKPDTPVPQGMDYIDIDATSVACGWASGDIEDVNRLDQVHNVFYEKIGGPTFDAIQQTEYKETSWKWSAQTFPVGFPKNPAPYSDGKYYVGNFIPVVKK